MTKKILLIFLISIIACQNASALYGTRPMGMGAAFTALSDDANAAFWNPAGVALNPEVSLTGSTMLNNRNTFVGDNITALKMCYEAKMNPFDWIIGVGAASVLALQSAQYLSDQGVLKKGWGGETPTTQRDESMTSDVKGTKEVVSLKAEAKDALKTIAQGITSGANKVAESASVQVAPRVYYFAPFASPWYAPNYYRPHYWEPKAAGPETKAQFALGLGWVNDYNARPTIDQNLNAYTISLASGFEQRVAVGGNINLYNVQKISTGIRGFGADIDLGVIAKPVEYISFGLATKGILTTEIKWQSGESTKNQMLVNAGVAIKPIYSLTLAVDSHNILGQGGQSATYHYGAEAVLLPGLLARAGLDDGNKTAGLSLALGNLVIDYSILGGKYNRSQMIGGSWRF